MVTGGAIATVVALSDAGAPAESNGAAESDGVSESESRAGPAPASNTESGGIPGSAGGELGSVAGD